MKFKLPRIAEKFKSIDDHLVGTDRADFLHGGRGNDSLIGAKGNDKLFGGSGNDYLSGNQGDDTLNGGRGADIFVFDGDFDRDVIRDFNACEGDSFEFVLYDPSQADWTGETLLNLCVERGRDIVLEMPGTDDSVLLKNVDLDEISADLFEVVFYDDAFAV